MKIALVTDQLGASPRADDYPADPARRVLSLASALAGQGHQVTVYSPQVPAGPPEGLQHIAALAGQLADRWSCDPPDVIHAHFWTSGLAVLAAARDLDIPVVQTFHSLGTGRGARPGRLLAGAVTPRGAAWKPRSGAAPRPLRLIQQMSGRPSLAWEFRGHR